MLLETLQKPVFGFWGLEFWDIGFDGSGLGFSFVKNCLLRRWNGPLESTLSPSGACVCVFFKGHTYTCLRAYIRTQVCASARVRAHIYISLEKRIIECTCARVFMCP